MPVLYETGQLWNKPNVMTVHWPLQLLWGIFLWKQHRKVWDWGGQRAEAHSTQCSCSSVEERLADASECFVKADRCCQWSEGALWEMAQTQHQLGHSCPLCWNGNAGPGDHTCQVPKCPIPRGLHLPSIAAHAGLTAQFSKLWKKTTSKLKQKDLRCKGV